MDENQEIQVDEIKPQKRKKNKAVIIIVLVIFALTASFMAFIFLMPDTFDDLIIQITSDKLSKSQLEEMCNIDNYTAVFEYEDDGLITDYVFTHDSQFLKYVDDTNNLSISDFHWFVYVYKVSESETHYVMTIEHMPTGDCVYSLEIEPDYEYYVERYDKTYTPAKYKYRTDEIIKGLTEYKFAENRYYSKYDYVSKNSVKDGDRDFVVFYGINVSDDEKLESVYYTKSIGKDDGFTLPYESMAFKLKDIGTTSAPAN